MVVQAEELGLKGPEGVEKQRIHVAVEPESRAEPKLIKAGDEIQIKTTKTKTTNTKNGNAQT